MIKKKTKLEYRPYVVTERLMQDISDLAKAKKKPLKAFLSESITNFFYFADSGRPYPKVDYDFASRLLPKYEVVREWTSCKLSLGMHLDDIERLKNMAKRKDVTMRDIIIDALVYTLALEYSKNIK